MLRQLLTLFAVLAGLTAAVEPARALEASVEAVHLAQDAAGCQLEAISFAAEKSEPARRTENGSGPCVRPGKRPRSSTVILQADRALE